MPRQKVLFSFFLFFFLSLSFETQKSSWIACMQSGVIIHLQRRGGERIFTAQVGNLGDWAWNLIKGGVFCFGCGA